MSWNQVSKSLRANVATAVARLGDGATTDEIARVAGYDRRPVGVALRQLVADGALSCRRRRGAVGAPPYVYQARGGDS